MLGFLQFAKKGRANTIAAHTPTHILPYTKVVPLKEKRKQCLLFRLSPAAPPATPAAALQEDYCCCCFAQSLVGKSKSKSELAS